MEQFEAGTLPDGTILILKNGVPLKMDYKSSEGADFISEYLMILSNRYPEMVLAIEEMLKSDLGTKFENTKRNSRFYNYLVAATSLNCCCGNLDKIIDFDNSGKFHFEFVCCPKRLTCPYNGYNEDKKGCKRVICNPVLKTDLSKTELKIADYLISTKLEATQIADMENLSLETVKSHRTNIYAKMGVSSRMELYNSLEGQRLL